VNGYTEAGEAWLKLLMVSILFTFGMECHLGEDKLSQFFKLIRIDTHVGISPSVLRALTVIHNYGLKRVDGTTAAMRLFGAEFPDLFS
jgi:hypothetical protein